MAGQPPLDRKTFQALAVSLGLDTQGAHGQELYQAVSSLLQGLRDLDHLDPGSVEPALVYLPQEHGRE